jgi:hypothetical protein
MDILPNTLEAWVLITIASLISFGLGRWIRTRRKKNMTYDDYVNGLKRSVLAEAQAQTKKAKKKKRRANKQN